MLSALNTFLRTGSLNISDGPFWVSNWNGNNGLSGFTSVNNTNFKNYVINQLGGTTVTLFNDNFVNYKEGLILCVNQSGVLDKFFTTSSGASAAGAYLDLKNNLRFICVRMPEQFKDKKSQLTSAYELGEKLRVIGSYENQTTNIQRPANATSIAQSVVPNTNRQVIIYRDSNIKGRGLKSSASGGGGGSSIGVWS